MKKAYIMSIALASAMTMSISSCQQAQRENPLLQESTLPFGAPDFSKIDSTHYLPAFEVAIQQTRDEIAAIVDNPDSATFENTILAYEESGTLLDRVSRVFFALVEADKTPALSDIEKKVQPMLTDLEIEISFNIALFERIKKVYDTQYEMLEGEDKKLTEETYKEFVRKGALLPDDKMARMKEISFSRSVSMGCTFFSMSASAGVLSASTRAKNTRLTRSSVLPLSSRARMVFSKVAESGLSTIAAISSRVCWMAASKAGM